MVDIVVFDHSDITADVAAGGEYWSCSGTSRCFGRGSWALAGTAGIIPMGGATASHALTEGSATARAIIEPKE